jgi:hypothetical protein
MSKAKAATGLAKGALGALEALVDAYKNKFDPETYYHGSRDSNIKKFVPWSREATFFTSDPKTASRYSWKDISPSEPHVKSETPVVYPVKIKTDDIFDHSDEKSWQKLYERDEAYVGGHTGTENLEEYMHHFEREFQNPAGLIGGKWWVYEAHLNFREYLKERGFRGYTTSEPGTVALFYPHKGDVRSVHAKFDPKKSKSGNILASVPAAGLMALGGAGALSDLTDE